jgi:hypothetical protein
MPKRGCLNCHFFCNVVIELGSNARVTESVDAKYRDKEVLAEFLNKRWPSRVRTLKCFCDNWDSERIGKENTTEIIKAIFRDDRKKCARFSKYDKDASPLAVKDRDDLKLEKIDKRIALILSVFSLLISTLSPLIAYLAFLKM